MKLLAILGLIIIIILGFFLMKFVSGEEENEQTLSEEKQNSRSLILRSYLDGEITKAEGVLQLRKLSCDIAERSGAEYNKEVCKF